MYSIDSRTIKSGDIFIPIKGKNFDGQDFIPYLIEKNIKIADTSLEKIAMMHRKNKTKGTVIGITGSSGKTTVKDMLTHLLRAKHKVHSTLENQNNEIGAPLTLINAPDDADFIIVEMGMRHRGDIQYLTNIIRPNITIITSIGTAHIELLKNQRNIAFGKAEIYDFPKDNKEYLAFISSTINQLNVINNQAIKHNFNTRIIKANNILDTNKSIVKSVGEFAGLSKKEIEISLNNFKPKSNHRNQTINWESNIIIDDTYNANPESMEYAIEAAKQNYPTKEIITVFGEMKELGKKEESYHSELAKITIKEERISSAIFYGDTYKRIEKKNHKCYYYTDKNLVLEKIKDMQPKNKIILFKGSRSAKMETIIKELTNHA